MPACCLTPLVLPRGTTPDRPRQFEQHSNAIITDYYGYRYYDAQLERWLNRDPLGEFGIGLCSARCKMMEA